jgi:hypothetical protein
VDLSPRGGRRDADGVYRFPTGTSSVLLAGRVAPERAGRRVRVRVNRLLADGTTRFARSGFVSTSSTGAFKFTFGRARNSTTYRAVARVAKDRTHAAGFSAPTTFAID